MTLPELTANGPAIEENRPSAKRLYYRSWFGIPSFFQNELKIVTKSVGDEAKLTFIPNPVQAPILKAAMEQLRTKGVIRQIIFKPRQPGISTYASGLVFNVVSMFDGPYAFIIAQDKSTVSRIFKMHEVFYRNLNEDVKPSLKYFTKDEEMTFGDPGEEDTGLNSMIRVGEAKNINLGVGRTVHVVHGTEVPRWPSSDPIKESLIPALSNAPGTIRIFEGTAHFGGGADWFRYQCERAMAEQARGKSGEYEYFFVQWWLLKEYAIPLEKGEKLKLDVEERHLVKRYGLTLENINWRRKQIEELEGDINAFYLSYPMNYEEGWITKETSAFPQDRLMELHANLKPPIKRFRIENKEMYEHDQGEFWVWVMPQKDKLYDIGADVGGGYRDGDWSVAEVISRGSNIQCAEYRARVIPSEFADVLAVIGRFYNTAQIGPEVNSYGLETCHELNKTYPNIFLWRKEDKIVPRMTGDLGWQTFHESKLLMVGLGHKRIYHRQVQIFSKVLWDELRYFGRDYTDTGRMTFGAVKGYDDTVMAWLIALKISDAETFDDASQDIDTKPKERERDPATYDAEWNKILSGQIDQDMITGSWPD